MDRTYVGGTPVPPTPPNPPTPAPQPTIPAPAQLRQEVADLSARIDAHLSGGAR
ncbi:hypothetical protein AB0D56_37940 [Streptomyces sp. NPDC048209]|uniref:hypothetical protein n=1 Tax=Streptomyces sp. NPDC048209 TaxID=3156689 RepID=UPI003442F9EC